MLCEDTHLFLLLEMLHDLKGNTMTQDITFLAMSKPKSAYCFSMLIHSLLYYLQVKYQSEFWHTIASLKSKGILYGISKGFMANIFK